jgi:hypothetical protein
MDKERLRKIYSENEVVKAICDRMAKFLNNQNETKLHRILSHLEEEGYDVKRSEVIAAFRLLEEVGCGRYVEGRHGSKSRFAWNVKSTLVKDVAQGAQSEKALEEDKESGAELDDELIEHSYVLRQDLTVIIELPTDLTVNEAKRLSQFIASLSFED